MSDFPEYVRDRGPAIVSSACRVSGDATEAEDVVHEVLARAYPRWARISAAAPRECRGPSSARRVTIDLRRPLGDRELRHSPYAFIAAQRCDRFLLIVKASVREEHRCSGVAGLRCPRRGTIKDGGGHPAR